MSNDVTTISERAVAAAPAPLTSQDFLATLGAMGFEVVQQVTRTVLQQVENVPFAVTIETAAYEGQELATGRGGAPKMAPARLCDVINLATGELQTLIMNTVLEGELVRSFGNGGYVGRSFVIKGYKPNDGDEGKKKSYRVYQIVEIRRADAGLHAEPVADGSDPVNAKGAKPKG